MKLAAIVMITVTLTVIATIPVPAAAVAPIVLQTKNGVDPAATNHVIPVPALLAVGDMVLVCIEFNGITGGTTYPAGWTQVTVPTTNTIEGVCVFRIIVSGDAITSITFTTTNLVADAFVEYQLAGATTVYRDFLGASGSSSSPDPPSLTISPSDNVMTVAVLFFGFSAFCHVTVYSSGFTSNTLASPDDGAISARAAMSTKTETIGTDNPGVATLSASCLWITHTIAIGGPAAVTSTTDLWLLLLLIFFWLLVFALSEDADNPIYIVTFSLFTAFLGVLLAIQVDIVVGNSILSVFVAALAIFMLIRGVFRVVGD